MSASMPARLGAEVLGTFWLVLVGCGTAVVAGDEVGFLGVALAFGLAVLTAAYAVGHLSGGHFNPAITLGLAVARRFPVKDVPLYAVAQVLGGSLAGGVLYAIASGRPGFTTADGFATNGYGDRSPAGYALGSAVVIELVMTFVFVLVVLGVTRRGAQAAVGPLAIGLTLTAIHLVTIPVTNTSVNPARSLGVAWFEPAALGQQWLFVLVPLLGGVLAGLVGPALLGRDEEGAKAAAG